MNIKLLNEDDLEFPSLKGGCTGWSESTLVKNATFLEITYRGSLMSIGMSLSLPVVSSADNLCKQFGPRSGSTKRQA